MAMSETIMPKGLLTVTLLASQMAALLRPASAAGADPMSPAVVGDTPEINILHLNRSALVRLVIAGLLSQFALRCRMSCDIVWASDGNF